MHSIPLKCNFHTVFYQTNQKIKIKKQNNNNKNHLLGTREMAQLVPSTSCSCRAPRVSSQKPQGLSVTTICNASSRKSDSVFWFPQVLHIHSTHAHFQANTLLYIYGRRLPNQKQSLPFLNTNIIHTPQTRVKWMVYYQLSYRARLLSSLCSSPG